MRAVIAVINKKGKDATEAGIAMLKNLAQKHIEKFGIASPSTVVINSSIDGLQTKLINSPLIIGYTFSETLSRDRPQPLKTKTATMVFEGRLYNPTSNISDAAFVAQELGRFPSKNAEEIIKKFEGDFVFVIAEDNCLVVGRDPLGVHPLYYGENSNFVALASQRKALWAIGIEKVISFPPGHIAIAKDSGFQFKPVKPLASSKIRETTIESAAKQLQKFLRASIQKRLSGLKEVAVAFSGGLDSSIIAFMAKKIVPDVHLIHVSLPDQPESDDAKKAAEALGLPLHIFLYDEGAVEKVLSKIFWIIEEANSIHASIAVPIFWTAEKTKEIGFKILLAGQGADELFGGYKKYVRSYQKHGREKVHQLIFNDIIKLYKINFERDFKICNYHSVELRLPFVTYEMAKFASHLSPELKIKLPDDGLRKLVLRYAAKNLGLPSFIIEKPKKAVQYATGVSRTLKKIAHKKGLSLEKYLQKVFKKSFKETMCYE